MTEPREKGWMSMGLPEPGPVSGTRGVEELLLLDFEDAFFRLMGLTIAAFSLASCCFSIVMVQMKFYAIQILPLIKLISISS